MATIKFARFFFFSQKIATGNFTANQITVSCNDRISPAKVRRIYSTRCTTQRTQRTRLCRIAQIYSRITVEKILLMLSDLGYIRTRSAFQLITQHIYTCQVLLMIDAATSVPPECRPQNQQNGLWSCSYLTQFLFLFQSFYIIILQIVIHKMRETIPVFVNTATRTNNVYCCSQPKVVLMRVLLSRTGQ